MRLTSVKKREKRGNPLRDTRDISLTKRMMVENVTSRYPQ